MRTIPPITKNLLIINVIMFLATWLMEGQGLQLSYYLGLHFFLSPGFHLYQFVTYMFMHGSIGHIFFNMFALWMFGCIIENVLGPKRYLIYYFACGIGAGLIQEMAQFGALMTATGYSTLGITVGASGAIYGILLAFGMLFPNERIFIFPLPIPIKAKWFITFYVLIELYSAMHTSGDGVAHMAHLGGMLIGFFMIRYWQHHPFNYYKPTGGRNVFDKMRDSWEKHTQKRPEEKPQSHESNPDWDYNVRKKQNQEEIDRILDKIRRSGYDSLTDEEKKTLFDSSDE